MAVKQKRSELRGIFLFWLQKYRFKKIVKQRRAMIQPSPGYEDPDTSICRELVCRYQELGDIDDHRGLWTIRREPEWTRMNRRKRRRKL